MIMENCYVLLGIAPTATTDEIEEAYQRKRLEFGLDFSRQKELDSAYNEAIMATFAPIRAFSSPLPPLTTGKMAPQAPQAAQPAPAQAIPAVPQPQIPVQAAPAQAVPQEPFLQPQFIQPQIQVQPAPVQPAPPPYVQEASQPAFQPAYSGPYIGAPADPALRDLVEETPVSFSDAELMNMDVSKIRGNYAPDTRDDDDETGFLISLGIENRLLRYYVKIYIAVVVFDMVMRLWVGPGWLMLTESISSDQMPRTPALLSILFAFVSVVYCFICALPVPFATRFFVLGQPPDKNSLMWTLFFLCVMSAYLLRWLTARFLPLNIAGSAVSFMVTAMMLSLGTLRYGGD